MSTTERDLPSAESDRSALGAMLDGEEFDEAMNDAMVEAEGGLDVGDRTDDDDVEVHDVVDAEADVDDDDVEESDGDSTDALRAQVDAALDADVDDDTVDADDPASDDTGRAELDEADDDGGPVEATEFDPEIEDGVARHGIRPAVGVVDVDDDTDYELPEIVPATPEACDDDELGDEVSDDADTVESPSLLDPGVRGPGVDDDELDEDLDDDAVSEEILEELRRADIDGPVVDFAPQDDTATARRRPRRSADYDPAPMPIPAKIPRVLGRKPRVRKVTRVVRHVDPWSVFKIALLANVVLYIIVLTASVLLWNVAHATGTVDNVERFFESFGWATFEFDGGEIYHAGWIAGLFVVIGLTGLAVLAATLFNLITDLVGGMRFTVLEEEVVETRTSPMRRFVVRRPEPDVPAVLRDGSGAMIREAVVDDTGANERPAR